jgi:hypothetical protein
MVLITLITDGKFDYNSIGRDGGEFLWG